MKALAEKISKNPYFVIIGWIATVLALIIAIVLPFIQAKKVRLSVSYTSNLLVTDEVSEMEGLDIKYKGNAIDQLSVTTCEICNTGNVTINDADIYEGHKLKILSEQDNVLFANVVSQSYDTNNGQVSYDDNSVNVHFDTLEKNEKIIINIYHSGDLNTAFSTDGKIKEGKIIPYSSDAENNRTYRFLMGSIIVSGILFLISSRWGGGVIRKQFRVVIELIYLVLMLLVIFVGLFSDIFTLFDALR